MTTGITIDFTANLARFTSSIDKATADLNKFQSNASRVAGQIKNSFGFLAAGLSMAGFTAFVKSSIDLADNLNDLSQKLGVSVEKLAGYRLAAESSGTSMEGMATAAKALSKNIAENDPLLGALGITARDVDGALVQLADVFAVLPDGADKTAIALRLMSKSGSDMIPMLNGGGAALRRMIEDGQKLSGITRETAQAADAFNDNLAKLKVSAEGAGVAIGGPLVSALNAAIEKYGEFRQKHGAFVSGLGAVGAAVVAPFERSNGEKALALQEKRNKLIEQLDRLRAAPGAEDTKAAGIAVLSAEIRKLGDELEKVWARDKIKLPSLDQLKAAAAQTNGLFGQLLKAEAPEVFKSKLDKAFDLSAMDRFVAGFDINAKKIEAEYARLGASIRMGPFSAEGAGGSDISGALALGRSALAGGRGDEATAYLERAKASLQAGLGSGAVGGEGTYYVEQLKNFELALNDLNQRAAESARDAMAQNFQAAQQVFKENRLKLNIDFDELGRNIKDFIAQISQELVIRPGVNPLAGASGGGTASMDIGWSSTAMGAR